MNKSWMWKQRSYREQFQGDEVGSAGGSAVDTQQADDAQDQDDAQAQDETSEDQQSTDAGDDQNADDGVIVTIGDEMPPTATDDEIEGKPAPAWLKDLRKSDREKSKRIRELEAEKAQREAAAAPKAEDVGPEPQLEEFDFDGIKYRDALLAWNERKRKADEQAAAARAEQEAAATAWNTKVTAYKTAKAALKVDDFDGAEHVVQSTLSQLQQNMIVHAVDKPELVVYALGSNPAKAKELAAIKDPVRFAVAIGKLETQLKVTPRKAPPAPERQVRGTAGGATIDNTLARLQADAEKSGDRTKVAAYLREQKRKQAA